MQRRLGEILVSSMVLLAACGNGDSGETATPTTTSSATTVSTAPGAGPTTVATTGPPSTIPSTTVGPACPTVTVPGGASNVTTAAGDYDGDGAPDVLRAFLSGVTWHLQVALAAGGGADLAVSPEGPAAIKAIGGFDVDEDGTDEAWAKVGAGASAEILGLFDLSACVLRAVVWNGSPARFPVGASAGSASGVECAKAGSGNVDLSVFSGTSNNGVNFMVESKLLHLEGATLTDLATDVFGAVGSSDVFSFDCGPLTL